MLIEPSFELAKVFPVLLLQYLHLLIAPLVHVLLHTLHVLMYLTVQLLPILFGERCSELLLALHELHLHRLKSVVVVKQSSRILVLLSLKLPDDGPEPNYLLLRSQNLLVLLVVDKIIMRSPRSLRLFNTLLPLQLHHSLQIPRHALGEDGSSSFPFLRFLALLLLFSLDDGVGFIFILTNNIVACLASRLKLVKDHELPPDIRSLLQLADLVQLILVVLKRILNPG
mmetsp:Transcript_8584/g.17413  ORF Transcript_8584/g.17413 Transcript_8584/m.17413 type:complete len:227 (-) Transcript_8584:233-913(-)